MPEPVRQTKLDVKPGLYVLRYVGSVDPRTAPRATVEPANGSADCISIISVPGRPSGEIAAPGGGLVILAAEAGAVEIRLEAFQGHQNFDAKFSLDLIGAGEGSQDSNPRAEKTTPAGGRDASLNQGRALVALDLMAHVSLRGDIRADADGWLAGPRMPSSVEGFQVGTGRGDVAISAQFRNTLSRGTWSPWGTPDAWIGTRQKASPLTGLRLKVVGDQADRFHLAGEALFLGAPKMAAQGGEIEFVAPSDLDPLVGLNLKLFERQAANRPAVEARPSRVRVFR